jgi:glycerate dehydrogenase
MTSDRGKMKIVVLDGYALNPGDISWDGIASLGELAVYDRTAYGLAGEDLIVERAAGAGAVFTNKTPLPRSVLERLPGLQFIGVLATGYNVVDVAAARELGVTVTNIPAYGTEAVAQMAVALLLELCHHAGAHSDAVKRGEWSASPDWCFWRYPLVELWGKTAGIVGYGRIGRATGRIAAALGMKVLAYDKFPDRVLENETMRYADLDTLYRQSDAIFLHCPLDEGNRGMIDRDSIARMKDGCFLVNNSRGPLVVESDLADALNRGKLAGAAVDVVSTEPIRPDNPLLAAKNCLITPHISWAPKEARERLMKLACENLKSYLDGKPVNVVNG